jgi:FixJ family two-component response regulator
MTTGYGANATVYIVEDDEAVRSALGLLAVSRGWNARLFASAQAFLADANRNNGHPACLVVDLQMPDMNGAELLERLKHENRQLPTIVLTAWPEGDMASRALAAGADQVMAKPCNPSHWLLAVDEMLGQ